MGWFIMLSFELYLSVFPKKQWHIFPIPNTIYPTQEQKLLMFPLLFTLLLNIRFFYFNNKNPYNKDLGLKMLTFSIQNTRTSFAAIKVFLTCYPYIILLTVNSHCSKKSSGTLWSNNKLAKKMQTKNTWT